MTGGNCKCVKGLTTRTRPYREGVREREGGAKRSLVRPTRFPTVTQAHPVFDYLHINYCYVNHQNIDYMIRAPFQYNKIIMMLRQACLSNHHSTVSSFVVQIQLVKGYMLFDIMKRKAFLSSEV